MLLVRITVVLAVSIFVINALLGRSLLESALFALAIAVGLTPQLLPAIVTDQPLDRRPAARRRSKVIVKRLVAIEDLGNIEVLFTDKTGHPHRGPDRVRGGASTRPGPPSEEVLRSGCCATRLRLQDGDVVGGNPLDRALWESAEAATRATGGYRRVARGALRLRAPLMSVLVDGTPTAAA